MTPKKNETKGERRPHPALDCGKFKGWDRAVRRVVVAPGHIRAERKKLQNSFRQLLEKFLRTIRYGLHNHLVLKPGIKDRVRPTCGQQQVNSSIATLTAKHRNKHSRILQI
jgi:hypothetical protein